MTDTADRADLNEAYAVAERAQFTNFEESTKEDWAIIAPQLNVTQGMVADRVLGQTRPGQQRLLDDGAAQETVDLRRGAFVGLGCHGSKRRRPPKRLVGAFTR